MRGQNSEPRKSAPPARRKHNTTSLTPFPGRIATMSEEVVNPGRTIPRAIIATLIVSALLYLAVAIAAIGATGFHRPCADRRREDQLQFFRAHHPCLLRHHKPCCAQAAAPATPLSALDQRARPCRLPCPDGVRSTTRLGMGAGLLAAGFVIRFTQRHGGAKADKSEKEPRA